MASETDGKQAAESARGSVADQAPGSAGEQTSQTGVRTTSVQVLDRAVALLEAMAAAGQQGVPLKQLAEKVGVRASTGRTLLASLVAHGLAAQHGHTRRYLLGPWFFELNRTYIAQSDLAAVAAPVLRELWEDTRETVHLAVLHGTRRVDISILVGPRLLNVNPSLAQAGDEAPFSLHRTAAGKVLFAGLTPRERSDLLAAAPWRTAAADPMPAEVLDEIERVGVRGYATNIEEEQAGVCGVAAPVVDDNGRTIAALCIGYPSVRHIPDHDAQLKDAVVAAAVRLSVLLGADPNQAPNQSPTAQE